jgi:hypothetical protein
MMAAAPLLRAFAIFALVSLASCAPTVTQVGPAEYSISRCRGLDACYQAASTTCANGFDVLHSGEHDGAIAQTYGDTTVVTPIVRNEILVQCRP